MSKITKYQAWNETKQYMMKDMRYLHLEGGDVISKDHLILRQYTGQKDKDGAEIYEGDIVAVVKFDHLKQDGTIDRQKCIELNYDFGVVEYMDYSCQYMLAKRQNKEQLTDQWNNTIAMKPSSMYYEVEIIGNIYENEELLR